VTRELFAHLAEPDQPWNFSGKDIRASWYVGPANRKWFRNGAVSQFLIEAMEDMKLIYPNPHLDVRALKKSLQAAD
jgi:hypothetical protein